MIFLYHEESNDLMKENIPNKSISNTCDMSVFPLT